MVINTLIINGIAIPSHARFDFSQTYEVIGGVSTFRTLNGNLNKQTRWESYSTTISGGGNVPAPIQYIDRINSVQLDCIAPMSGITNSLIFTIPRGFRDDIPPIAQGIDGDDFIFTPSELLGQNVTITPIPGVTKYIVSYYPRMDVFIIDLNDSINANSKETGWSLTCEEIVSVL